MVQAPRQLQQRWRRWRVIRVGEHLSLATPRPSRSTFWWDLVVELLTDDNFFAWFDVVMVTWPQETPIKNQVIAKVKAIRYKNNSVYLTYSDLSCWRPPKCPLSLVCVIPYYYGYPISPNSTKQSVSNNHWSQKFGNQCRLRRPSPSSLWSSLPTNNQRKTLKIRRRI